MSGGHWNYLFYKIEERQSPRQPEPRKSATVEFLHDGKRYKGTVYAIEEG